MKIVEGTISRQDLSTLAQNLYGDMIRAVTDVDKGLLAIYKQYPHIFDIESIFYGKYLSLRTIN